MLRIRGIEEEIAARYSEQEMRCPVHLSIGQEATAVGVCQALTGKDRVFSTHRCHAHYIAKGGSPRRMMAEIYGKAAGCIGGRGGSMHLMDLSVGMFVSVPIVGSSIPLAVGAALSNKFRGDDSVTVAFVGDASLEEGVFHESMNFASLHKLPILFVCENNLYSVYTPITQRQPKRPISALGQAHGVPAVAADGNDVLAVYEAARVAVARARWGEGPTFLVFDTYRWREHCGPNYDNHLGYRTEAEYERWRKLCPLERYKERLIAAGDLSPEREAEIATQVREEVEDAFAFARDAELPTPKTAFDHVYA